MRIVFSIIVFLAIINSGKSQEFLFEANLLKADSNGYYKIVLPPSIFSALNREKTDLRIYDTEGKEVPYLMEEESDSLGGNFEEIPGVSFKQSDNTLSKKTTLEINLKHPHKMDKIEFDLEAPVHYRRWGEITASEVDAANKRWRKRRNRAVHIPIELSSEDPLSYNIDELKTNHLLVEINNEDNSPIKFRRARILQIKHYLIAYLENDKHYSTHYGNKGVSYPDYDLRYFKSKIPYSLPTLKIENIKRIKTNFVPVELPFYQSKSFLWAAIIVVILFLAFVSIKMVVTTQVEKKISNG